MKSKKLRQYTGLVAALLSYYIVHEGAHFLYALINGVFKKVNIMGILGVQIDVYREQMSDTMLGIFCLVGPLATFVAAWVLILCAKRICQMSSPMFKAIMFYVTIIMMFLDPLYLSVIYRFVGGGDMNGISLLVPELAASIGFGLLFVLHMVVFVKYILPSYTKAFQNQ